MGNTGRTVLGHHPKNLVNGIGSCGLPFSDIPKRVRRGVFGRGRGGGTVEHYSGNVWERGGNFTTGTFQRG